MPVVSSSSSDQNSDRIYDPLHDAIHGVGFTSRARVVFMGHGADEQCCGYVRHRSRSGGLWIRQNTDIVKKYFLI